MRVITNAFWLSFSRIGADLLSFVLFAAISRSFGPAGTGEYSYAFAVATLVALAVTAGFEDYGIRQYARTSEEQRPRLWQNLLSTQCVQLLLVCVAFAIFLVATPMTATRQVVVLELSIYVVGWTISYTFFIPSLASQAMAGPALMDLACRMSAILYALVLPLFGHFSLPLLLAGFPLAGLALAALALRSASRHGASLGVNLSWRGVTSTWRATSAFAGSEILNQFYARADLLLIAYFLGTASVGLYATDIKFVEVGILPLVLLGTAAYPLLSSHAAREPDAFRLSARDFTRIVFFASGWLAVGMFCVIPLLIVPLFGDKFAPSAAMLPWFALFVMLKSWEVAFYRLLYALKRQQFYFLSLVIGTVVIVVLNLEFIPVYGLQGAVAAAVVSNLVVNVACAAGLARKLGGSFLGLILGRLALALGATAALVALLERVLGATQWVTALAAAVVYPLLGSILGMVPHPSHSLLLREARVQSP